MKSKKEKTKEVTKTEKKTASKEKTNVFTKIANFIGGVKTEFKRVKWPSKKEMLKYSFATIIFIISCSLFFYLIDIILAALHSLGK